MLSTDSRANLQYEAQLKQQIRAVLPEGAFSPRPAQALIAVLMVLLAGAGTVLVIRAALPWYAAVPIALLIGNLHAALFFFGHYLTHGSVLRSRRLQDLLLYPCFLMLCLSPHLWRIWHHHAHHPNTNVQGRDPDLFISYEEFLRSPQTHALAHLAPGSGRWLANLFFLCTYFTLQVLGVLFGKSIGNPAFKHLNRRWATIETGLMMLFWVGLSCYVGVRGFLFGVLIPWVTANVITLSYILTQHLLRPQGQPGEALRTSLSLSKNRFIDWVHFLTSHHVEHHLFPTLPFHLLPEVREQLQRRAVGFLVAPHGRALHTLFLTPRFYDGPETLVDPFTGHRVSLALVESVLKGESSKKALKAEK